MRSSNLNNTSEIRDSSILQANQINNPSENPTNQPEKISSPSSKYLGYQKQEFEPYAQLDKSSYELQWQQFDRAQHERAVKELKGIENQKSQNKNKNGSQFDQQQSNPGEQSTAGPNKLQNNNNNNQNEISSMQSPAEDEKKASQDQQSHLEFLEKQLLELQKEIQYLKDPNNRYSQANQQIPSNRKLMTPNSDSRYTMQENSRLKSHSPIQQNNKTYTNSKPSSDVKLRQLDSQKSELVQLLNDIKRQKQRPQNVYPTFTPQKQSSMAGSQDRAYSFQHINAPDRFNQNINNHNNSIDIIDQQDFQDSPKIGLNSTKGLPILDSNKQYLYNSHDLSKSRVIRPLFKSNSKIRSSHNHYPMNQSYIQNDHLQSRKRLNTMDYQDKYKRTNYSMIDQDSDNDNDEQKGRMNLEMKTYFDLRRSYSRDQKKRTFSNINYKGMRTYNNSDIMAGRVPLEMSQSVKQSFQVQSPQKTVQDHGDPLQQLAYKMYHDTTIQREKNQGRILNQLQAQNTVMQKIIEQYRFRAVNEERNIRDKISNLEQEKQTLINLKKTEKMLEMLSGTLSQRLYQHKNSMKYFSNQINSEFDPRMMPVIPINGHIQTQPQYIPSNADFQKLMMSANEFDKRKFSDEKCQSQRMLSQKKNKAKEPWNNNYQDQYYMYRNTKQF